MRDYGDNIHTSDSRRVQGWSVTGTIQIPPSTISPQETPRQITLQQNFSVASVYTVQFSKRLPVDPRLFTIRPQAFITGTVAGNSTSRRVDVADGASISGTCDAINVDIYDHFSDPHATDILEYIVSATVTPGTRPTSGSPPTLTIRKAPNGGAFQASGAGGTENIPVRADAGINAFWLAIQPLGTASAPIRYGTGDIAIVQRTTLAGGILAISNYDSSSQWTPLVAGCGNIEVINRLPLAGDVVTISPIFGIQG